MINFILKKFRNKINNQRERSEKIQMKIHKPETVDTLRERERERELYFSEIIIHKARDETL